MAEAPSLTLQFGGEITDEEVAALRERFLEAVRNEAPQVLASSVSLEALTSQEWEIIKAIRSRDSGKPDGEFAELFARWARGQIDIGWRTR